jgi:hypothetical protein
LRLLPPPVGVGGGVEDWSSACAGSLLVAVLDALAVGVDVVVTGEPPIARYPRSRLGGRERRARSVVRTVRGAGFGALAWVVGSAAGSLADAML